MEERAGRKLSFEEFKLYYESTEKVTDRRLETNRWNYSICVAMLIANAVLVKWSLTTKDLLWAGFAGVGIISVMAALFCALWIGQIRDFKKLNNAKFTVLNEMAPDLAFDSDLQNMQVSYCPFVKEWAKLRQMNALEEVGRSNLVALKSSNIEYFIPRAFAFLFLCILVSLIGISVVDWPPTNLVHPAQPSTSTTGHTQ